MPRNASIELLYSPLPAAITAFGPAKGAVGGYTEIAYNVDQPLEPVLFTIHIPKITIATLNASVTLFIVDSTVAGKTQILAEATVEGITAAGNAGPVTVLRRVIPEKDFTEEPALEGRRRFTIEAEASAGTFTVPANTAKTVAFVKIDGLARQ